MSTLLALYMLYTAQLEAEDKTKNKLRRQLQHRRIRRQIQLKRLAEAKMKENTTKSSGSSNISKAEAESSDLPVNHEGYHVMEYVDYES